MSFSAPKIFLGKNVTVLTPLSNQPVSPAANYELYSGILREIGSDYLLLELVDGTSAFFWIHNLIGLIENKEIEEESDNSSVRK